MIDQNAPKIEAPTPALWFARLYVALHTGVTASVACFGVGTLLHKTLELSGPIGFWASFTLLGVAFWGVLDVIINDLLPKRFTLCKTKLFRHYLLMLMAIGLASLAYVIAKEIGVSILHGQIFLGVFGACALAFLDIYERHDKCH